MKKKKAVLTALIAVGLLTGCLGRGGNSVLNSESSRIFVTSEGTLQTSTIESYDEQDYYNAEELKLYLEEAAAAYNEAASPGAVTLTSCTLEKGKAQMVFTYGSGRDLVGFVSEYEDRENQVDSIDVTSLGLILGEIQSEGVVLVKASDNKAADEKTLLKRKEAYAIVVESPAPVTIQTQKRILFVSDQAVVKDSHTIETAQGKNYIIFK
ncbi:MAG: hypothetical protein QM657_01665 [Lacrimispora sp.]|uniref:hypothetical protein n=1 Tax=Lacrimispora sp. TaxID=2719234 RepID=UPI0039E65CA1